MPFSPTNQGCKYVYSFLGIVFQYQVDNLVICVTDHFLTRNKGVSIGSASIKQAEEIINFGNCANR